MRISDWSSDVCSSDLQRLTDRGYRAQVVNASVSGETTAGGLARLPALLAHHHPDVVLIELGGNDGLRAQPIAKLRDNLQQLVALAKKAGAQAAVFEMLLPPNYGPEYVSQFTERSEEHTSELQSLMRISYAVFCLKKKK